MSNIITRQKRLFRKKMGGGSSETLIMESKSMRLDEEQIPLPGEGKGDLVVTYVILCLVVMGQEKSSDKRARAEAA